MRLFTLIALTLMPAIPAAQQASQSQSGELRILDKVTGIVRDEVLSVGQSTTIGRLTVALNDCRYPASNPNGDAYGEMTITYRDNPTPIFSGWMVASAPALNALDHPRYDVWILRCITS